jgi:hypothetical protein
MLDCTFLDDLSVDQCLTVFYSIKIEKALSVVRNAEQAMWTLV